MTVRYTLIGLARCSINAAIASSWVDQPCSMRSTCGAQRGSISWVSITSHTSATAPISTWTRNRSDCGGVLQVKDQPARPLELQVGAGVGRVGVRPALDDAEAAADAGIDVDLPRLAHAGREPLADLGRVDPRVEDILGLRPEETADAGADGRGGRTKHLLVCAAR